MKAIHIILVCRSLNAANMLLFDTNTLQNRIFL